MQQQKLLCDNEICNFFWGGGFGSKQPYLNIRKQTIGTLN